MKNMAPPSIENKPIEPPWPELPLTTEAKIFFAGDGFYEVRYLAQKRETIQVCSVESEHGVSWYWQRFGCIPPLGEIGPFNSKEEALKDVKETFARELVVFGDGNGP